MSESSLSDSSKDSEFIESSSSNEEYEVEKILRHRIINGKFLFEIKWKGYPISENSWVPEKELNCDKLLKEYMEKISLRASNTRSETKPQPQPVKILSMEKTAQSIVYKVVLDNDQETTITSDKIRKLNPELAIEFLEQRTEFSEEK